MNLISSLITAVTRHRVSADVIMMVFMLSGIWAIFQFSVRFFPPFEINTIIVTVVKPSSTASDIEESVVIPLENSLREVPDFKKIYSYSRERSGTVILEFPDSVDIDNALEDVKAQIEVVNFPSDAEAPRTSVAEFGLSITDLTVVGTHPDELRSLVRRLENSLNQEGIGKVSVTGLPREGIDVLVDQQKLIELNISLAQIGQALGAQNRNATVGSVIGLGSELKLRSNAKTSDFSALYNLPVATSQDGSVVYLRDIAHIVRREARDQDTILYNGRPAATIKISSSGGGNIISSAGLIMDWAERQRATLPPSVELVFHNEEWRAVQSRLLLLVENGIVGMFLVVGVLFLFLSFRVAIWVAAGIPVAMLGTLFVFYQLGGTINMISMFALIMAVGIIVDDAIVVGENAQYRLSRGEPPMRAVISAARTMFTPVFASSFTTIAAFMPLFLITGTIGAIIFDIPMIIVCILIAALIECFLVLPGHLYRAFAKRELTGPGLVRRNLDGAVDHLRERIFRPLSAFSVNHAFATVSACFMIFFLSIQLLVNGFVNYRFFPGADGNGLFGTVVFASGTPRAKVEAYVMQMQAALELADEEAEPDVKLLNHVHVIQGAGSDFEPTGDNRAQINVELVDPEFRSTTVDEFARVWRNNLEQVPGIIKLDVRGEGGGPPGRDVEVRMAAQDVSQIKPAAQRVKEALETIPGISSAGDDTPFGKEQVLFSLTPLGRKLNIEVQDVANQLRFALDGYEVQSFTEGVDEIDLNIKMADFDSTNVFSTMYLRLPSGEYAPLRDIVTWRTEQGFDTILHQFGSPAIVVSADLDPEAPTTVGAVLEELENTILKDLYQNEGITYSFEGKNADEEQTAKDMMTGMVLAVILIYIILTWVFNSWSLPLVIMLTMPLGVIGTIVGHWIMGLSMSILSFFGMFTLMGILVNNSIVLVDCFKSLGVENNDREQYNAAIVEASCLRMRAVLLTSLTTIGGLLPLMFETSIQAQFLLPMAVSICFGLAFAALLILFFMPACMALHGAVGRMFSRTHRPGRGGKHQPRPLKTIPAG